MNRLDSSRPPLHGRPALALAIVVIGYVLTELLSGLTVHLAGLQQAMSQVFVKLGWFSAFTFLFIPKALRLPAGDGTIRGFIRHVGLRTTGRTGRLVILGLSCYLIFIGSQLTGTVIYHAGRPESWVPDPSRHGLLDAGSIVAGVFEEVVMRGVIVTLLLRSVTARRAILVSAAVFAALHLFNLLNPDRHPVWVLCQVAWAFGLGVMYGYMYVRTRSLLPLIILHYLINGLVNVWFRGLDPQSLASAFYGVPFFGVVPAALAIAWTAFLARRWGLGAAPPQRPA